MTLEDIQHLLSQIKGCTFASLDAETKPAPGYRKQVLNEQVMLFTNQGGSAYERLVRRRLASIGRDPDSFVVGSLPFGERIPGTPVIEHYNGYCIKHYLQCVILKPGEVRAWMGQTQVDPSISAVFSRDKSIRDTASHQGLPEEKAVIVRTYCLDNIMAIRLMGDTVG